MQSDRYLRLSILSLLLTGLTACGGSGSDSGAVSTGSTGSTTQNVAVPVFLSDAASDDWATIGVKVLSVALVPQGDGANVSVYQAPADAPVVNLAQLDNLADVIGNVAVPAGTYAGAVVTISANPGDVALVSASDPEVGFAGPAGTAIPSSQIQIQNTQGASGKLTTSIDVNFKVALTVSASSVAPLDLEFDLNHPAFIVEHTPPAAAGATIWAVNFAGALHRHPITAIANRVLRHLYGTVTGLSSDQSTLSFTKDWASWPAVSPETATSTGVVLSAQADATNGTLFYDMDANTESTIKDFSSLAATLSAGEYVRIAARYQSDGTLIAVRIWASSHFNDVWVSPEGHVRHVNSAANTISVDDEDGRAVQIGINAGTQFFFRTPQSAIADAMPIATGTGFLSGGNVARGFKVHVSVVDPLANSLVAQSIDIENAHYSGSITGVTVGNFQIMHDYVAATDDYAVQLPYIAASTAQNPDATGYGGVGFQWWNLGFPTLADTGAGAVNDFISATGGTVLFGSGPVPVWGSSAALWGNAAASAGWSAPWVVLEPVRLPLASVSSAASFNASGGSLSIVPLSASSSTPSTVDLSTSNGAATLAYQVDRSNGQVTVSEEDLTTASGQAALSANLASGAHVRLYGVPQSSGHLKAYAIFYFTGTAVID